MGVSPYFLVLFLGTLATASRYLRIESLVSVSIAASPVISRNSSNVAVCPLAVLSDQSELGPLSAFSCNTPPRLAGRN